MVKQTHHTPPVLLLFPDAGTEFSGFLFSALFGHLADHTLEPIFLGPLLLDDIPDGVTPALSTLSLLVLLYDLPYGVSENLLASFTNAQRPSSWLWLTHGDGVV